jgi:hypothetical protein
MADKGTVLVTNDAGSPWVKMLVGTATWDPANIAADAGVCTATTVTIAGARVGDPTLAALTTNTTTVAEVFSQVTADDTVSVSIFNKTGAAYNATSGTLKVVVFKI